jgi:hypothetical protein
MPILNGKKVVDLEIDGVDSRDFPDFSDAFQVDAMKMEHH